MLSDLLNLENKKGNYPLGKKIVNQTIGINTETAINI